MTPFDTIPIGKAFMPRAFNTAYAGRQMRRMLRAGVREGVLKKLGYNYVNDRTMVTVYARVK